MTTTSATPEPDEPATSSIAPERFAVPDDLHQRPVGEHVEIYEALHRDLQQALGAIDGG